jgi:hypothetical protein
VSYGLVMVLILIGAVAYYTGRMSRSRPSDVEAIETYAKSKNLRVVSVSQNNGRWRYWLRGRLLLSNLARTFIVVAESPDGARHEIHVAFDPWAFSKGLQVLQERQISVDGRGANSA